MNSNLPLAWYDVTRIFSKEYWKNTFFGSYNEVDAYTGRQTNDPLDAFGIIDFDTVNTTAGQSNYYGGVAPNGDWCIQQWNLVSGTWANGIIHINYATYKNGTNAIVNNYNTEILAFAARTSLTYAEKQVVFAGNFPN